MTRSGLDLVIRGMMRSLSKDPEECHSCLSSYRYAYYAVISLEDVYYGWSQVTEGINGSY